MRAAPAVAVELGGSPAWQLAQALIWAAAVGALCAWLLARDGHAASLGLLAALPAGLGAWRLTREPPTTLTWDGQHWLLGGTAVRLTVALDLDRWVLLRLQAADSPATTRWLPAAAAQAGTRWHGLRAALYSRAPESPPAATPPARAVAPD